MRLIITIFVVLVSLPCQSAEATSIFICDDSTPAESLKVSDVVVAATVEGISLERADHSFEQTVLWRVNESWKGRHYKNSTFTTRVRLSKTEHIEIGQAFLLRLNGTEPYEWVSCAKNRGLLQDSLEEVHEIYKEFYRMRELPPNSSSKPDL